VCGDCAHFARIENEHHDVNLLFALAVRRNLPGATNTFDSEEKMMNGLIERQIVLRNPMRKGFTLIEVLLVLIILVVLGSMSVSMIGNTRQRAFTNTAKTQIGAFKANLDEYLLDNDSYPSSLQALRTMPGEANPNKWKAIIQQDPPNDPWGHQYQFQFPGQHNPDTYDLWSMGPDGQTGTADDIGNWMQN
jgi:general secretion pathway protein G